MNTTTDHITTNEELRTAVLREIEWWKFTLIRCAAPPWVPRPQRAMRAAPTRATLQVLTPTWPRPA